MSLDGDQLVDQAHAVETRLQFLAFLSNLIVNRSAHPEEWENADLPSFLQGMEGFARDYEGYVANTGDHPESNPWRLVATLLLAATVYE